MSISTDSSPVGLVGLHGDQVDDALEALAVADRQLQGRRAGDAVLQPVHHAAPVGVLLVHPVDDDEGRQVRGAHEVPQVLRGDLETAVGLDDKHDAFDDPQGRVDVSPEIVHARRVDDVDLVALEFRPGHAGGDGLLALDFLLEEIEQGAAVVDAALAADLSGDVEHRIGQAGLADAVGADQGHVADFFHGIGLQRTSSRVDGDKRAGNRRSGYGFFDERQW